MNYNNANENKHLNLLIWLLKCQLQAISCHWLFRLFSFSFERMCVRCTHVMLMRMLYYVATVVVVAFLSVAFAFIATAIAIATGFVVTQ